MSELALQLIAENKKTRSTFLDLANCGLVEIPDELGELVWLEYLSLADEWIEWDGKVWQRRKSQNIGDSNRNLVVVTPLAGLINLRSLILPYAQVTDLSPLAGLTALQTLELGGPHVADLRPLAGLIALHTLTILDFAVGDLSPLSSLTALQRLNIAIPDMTDLSPLASLLGLKELSIARTKVSDLSPLANLTALQSLDVWETEVADLSPLANLIALQDLNVSNTEITDLSPLGGLIALRRLNTANTEVADLWPLGNLTALQSLDLSRTQVSDLSPLDTLPALQALNIAETLVSDLSPLATMTALRRLIIPETHVTDLWPLATLTGLQLLDVSATRVTDLFPVANLTGLQILDFSGTDVTDLSPLSSLSELKALTIAETSVSDLSPLANLTALQSLNVWETEVADLSPLANLIALQDLNVSNTEITDLSPLARLIAIKTLNISSTDVTDLSPLRELISRGLKVLWSSEAWKSPCMYVENCPLVNPPVEIVSQGNDAILNYFRERELGGVDHLYEAKMLILGEAGAGKTSLLRRLYQPNQPLPTEKETTKGISIYRHEFPLKNGRRFHLNVWDFGGQEIYHATHQFFLTRRSLYVLVDDTRKDHKSVSDDGFKYWLELIDLFGGHSPVLIFQNEKSGRSKAIDLAGIKGQYDNIKERYAGNLEKTTAADQLRDGIEFYASNLSHIGEQLPARWIQLREEIEKRAGVTPYVTQQEYFEIYGRHLEFDRTKALHLSRYLHDLGVFLHFQDDPLLARSVILQNEWATEAVFRMLDDETVKVQLGRFNNADCRRVWCDSIYADMHPELLALMQRFELCYLLADSNPQTWLAPQLLPPTKPITLTDWGEPQDLVLRYHYDFMPKGLISRLTVRLHRFVHDPEMAWVTGVLFERDKTMVLVEVLASGREIELRGRGPDRKALLSVISADLDALNESFQGFRDKVNKRIPCNCTLCSAATVPEFFPQKNLLKRKEDNRLKLECPNSYEDVDVLELLDGIRVDKLPRWAEEENHTGTVRTVRIFLASSAELRADRDEFDLYFRQQNDRLIDQGFYLEIDRWENSLDAVSETRLQDEYNKRIRDCDIFVSLFFTKTGKYTEEEFDIAHQQFKDRGKPRIYTFFKDADFKTGSARKEDFNSLWAFQEKLSSLGHFYTRYENIEHLKRQFRDQLDRLLSAYDSRDTYPT